MQDKKKITQNFTGKRGQLFLSLKKKTISARRKIKYVNKFQPTKNTLLKHRSILTKWRKKDGKDIIKYCFQDVRTSRK